MKTVIHNAESRGYADHGWLKTHHSFSFANWYNPEKMNFGTLRVLNDDFVDAGMGFGKHPHNNMEIITIPLEGDLQHQDDMGNNGVIKNGDVQVMSAGTGIKHSEMNANKDKPVKLLQIWVFPREKEVTPRYGQVNVVKDYIKNEFQEVVSPNENTKGVWIHQDAWFNLADFDKGVLRPYQIRKEGNGAYIFVLEGKIKVGEQVIGRRDAMGLWETDSFEIEVLEDCRFLVLDVPMELPSYLM